MNELMKITVNEEQEPIVSGRDLYEFLEMKAPYTQWFDRMIEYGFAENVDFAVIHNFVKDETAFGGERKITDHAIKLSMAKELSMIQRNDKGKQARQYFIRIEEDWNSPDKVMARALKIADKEINRLRLISETQQAKITEMRPKEIFADSVSVSDGTILIGELAKILRGNNIDIGEKRLFIWLRQNGYLIKRKGTDYNAPTQKSMELELFKVKETAITHSDGHVTVSKTTKVTGKGQIYFINKFKAA